MSEERSLTLYEVETELMEALEMSDDSDPTFPQPLDTVIALYLEGAIEKRDRVAGFLKHLETQAEFAAAEIKRLQDRKRKFENAQKRLKDNIAHVMALTGQKKLEGKTSTLSLRKNPPRVVIVDEELVPAEFKTRTETWTVDKKRLKAHLEGLDEVRRGYTWAWAYLEQGESVVVR